MCQAAPQGEGAPKAPSPPSPAGAPPQRRPFVPPDFNPDVKVGCDSLCWAALRLGLRTERPLASYSAAHQISCLSSYLLKAWHSSA